MADPQSPIAAPGRPPPDVDMPVIRLHRECVTLHHLYLVTRNDSS